MSAESFNDGGNELTVSEARARFTDLVNRAEYRDEITIIGRRGRGPVAAIVPLDVLEAAERWEDEQLGREAQDALDEMETTGARPVPWDDLRRELNL